MLAKYVSEETVIEAGFNYWEPSYLFQHGNKWCRVYHSYLHGKNIVIIGSQRRSSDGKTRRDWYFSTFEGRNFPEQDQANVDRNFRITLKRKHRVAGRELEAKIQSTLDNPSELTVDLFK